MGLEQRQIIHVDMDAFYAQVEMRDNPKLRTVPLILAKDPLKTGGRGVVATANYLARRSGVHSAMSAQEAKKLVPNAVFLTPNFEKYKQVSKAVHKIFHEYTDMIEPIAFDEAYLDVTSNKLGIHNPVVLAHRMQQEIWAKLNLTCSTGISYNKFIAKMASEYNKPVGVTIIHEAYAIDFLKSQPISSFRGIGKKTLPQMQALNILNGSDLYDKSEEFLLQHFGKLGYNLYRRVRGIDNRPVEWQRERKSIGKEATFIPPLTNNGQIKKALNKLATELVNVLQREQLHGQTLVVKIRDVEFATITKRLTQVDFYPNKSTELVIVAEKILATLALEERPIRLLGITMTGLAPVTFENINLPLFE